VTAPSIIGIFGSGGCGRGIMPLVKQSYPDAIGMFVVDESGADTINRHPQVSLEAFARLADSKAIAIAVADPGTRARIAGDCRAQGLDFCSVVAAQSVRMDDVRIGNGALVSPYTTLTSNIVIGDHFHCNLYSYVEHDCVIGDFVTFAPAVRCNGNVTIGDRAYVGSNAVIRQGVTIGADAVIGMGAVVTKDVPAGATVVGNPARPIVR
jgi:sugar O-acyltransferase (sialic acid O-acetyltransferase NeuD family)